MSAWLRVPPHLKHAEVLGDDGVVELDLIGGSAEHHAPVLMMTTSSARSSVSLMFCSTSTIDCPSALSWAMVRPTSATSCGARPSDGSSISSTRGLPISARPIASICCSPPDSEPASWACRSYSRGNSRNTRSIVQSGPPPFACADLRRDHQILAHGQRAEHAPALRHETDALARDDVGREAGDRLAVQADRAAARLEEAHDRRHAGGLAGAVAAEQAEQATRLQRERARRAARGCRRNRCRCRKWRAPQSPR